MHCNSELDNRVKENEQQILLEDPVYEDIKCANNLQPSNMSSNTFVFFFVLSRHIKVVK
jgi:hypothetical protein